MNMLIRESSVLQYTLELAITGNEDGEHSQLSVAEKLNALRKHQRAWDKLKWNHELRHSMAGGGLWELFGNVLAQQDLTGSLVFRQLPSRYRGIQDKEWRVKPDPQLKVRDFGIDPSQDLLVLVEAPRWRGQNPDHCYRFHLKSMSSCDKHPQASGDGVLVHKQELPDPHLSYSIQVSGDHLGILFHSVEADINELIVWNWRSGHMYMHLTGDEMRSFSFLSEQHVVVALVSLSPADEFNASLLVVDYTLESSDKKEYDEVVYSYSLSLPRLSPSTLPIRFAIRCDPSPSWTPDPNLRVPFHLARSNRVYAVSLQVQTDDIDDEEEEGGHLLELFVPQSTFLGYMGVLGKAQRQIDWETWGPGGTRFMEFPRGQVNSTTWVCCSYGSRYVVKECSSRTNDTCMVLLYDFNKRARAEDTIPQTQDPSVLPVLPPDESFHVTTPTEIKKIFATNVSTSMPYRVHSVALPAADAHCTLMCSEDALIVVDADSSKGERQYRLLTF